MPQNNSNEVPFFHHLFMEHAFLFRATGFILVLKSCLFDSFFRRIFAIESKKKVTLLKSLMSQKKCLSPSDINQWESEKKVTLSFILTTACGNIGECALKKSCCFLTNFSLFSLFLLLKRWHVMFFCFSFVFFHHKH